MSFQSISAIKSNVVAETHPYMMTDYKPRQLSLNLPFLKLLFSFIYKATVKKNIFLSRAWWKCGGASWRRLSVDTLLLPTHQYSFKPGIFDMCIVILCCLSFKTFIFLLRPVWTVPYFNCYLSIALEVLTILWLHPYLSQWTARKLNYLKSEVIGISKNAGLINMALLKEIAKLFAFYVMNKLWAEPGMWKDIAKQITSGY